MPIRGRGDTQTAVTATALLGRVPRTLDYLLSAVSADGRLPPQCSGRLAHESLCYIPRVRIIESPIPLKDLAQMAESGFGNLVKAVLDVELGIMAVDGELHADEEALLLEHGSEQRHLWGINIYPDLPKAERIEFDSMINIRPSQGNRSRGVDDPAIRDRIVQVVDHLTGA